MNALDHPTDYILSFRHLLTSAVTEFLSERQMNCPQTAEALSELIVSLSSYREEGSPLFPQVFVCEDITAMLQALRGRDPMSVSDGDRSRETMRRALKQCAPLSRGGWAIYFQLDEPGRFSYGLFRTDSFILSSTPIELLRAIKDPSIKLLGISRVAENIIELCASAGYRRFIHLSGARTDVPHPTRVLEDIVQAVTADVDEPFRLPAQCFFRHAFFDAMQAPYGSLAMVIPKNAPHSHLLDDGVMLQPSIDVVGRIEAYKSDPREEKATSLQAVVTLLHGMLSADGITVLRSDGCLVGYNVFVEQPPLHEGEIPIGGARRRSFNVLCQHLGHELTAAFYRSQDGVALCERAANPPAQSLSDPLPQAAHNEMAQTDSRPPSVYEPMELVTPAPPHAIPNAPGAHLDAAQSQLQTATAAPVSATPVPVTIPAPQHLPPQQTIAPLAQDHLQAVPSTPPHPLPAPDSMPAFVQQHAPQLMTPQTQTQHLDTQIAPPQAHSLPPQTLDAQIAPHAIPNAPGAHLDAAQPQLQTATAAPVPVVTIPAPQHLPPQQTIAPLAQEQLQAVPSTPPRPLPAPDSMPAFVQQHAPQLMTPQPQTQHLDTQIAPPQAHSLPPQTLFATPPVAPNAEAPNSEAPGYPAGQRALIDALCRNELHPIQQMTPAIQDAPPAQESMPLPNSSANLPPNATPAPAVERAQTLPPGHENK
ncbi:MAG: hypothetical protein IKC51_07730 [Myxococcaceae bacterium]|nr:hypothetical protein [Myxococcaceae bacterium]